MRRAFRVGEERKEKRNETKETPPRANICYSNTETNSYTVNVKKLHTTSTTFEIERKESPVNLYISSPLSLCTTIKKIFFQLKKTQSIRSIASSKKKTSPFWDINYPPAKGNNGQQKYPFFGQITSTFVFPLSESSSFFLRKARRTREEKKRGGDRAGRKFLLPLNHRLVQKKEGERERYREI